MDVFRRGVPVAGTLDGTGRVCGVLVAAWKDNDVTVSLAVNPRLTGIEFKWPDGTKCRPAPLQATSRRLD